MKKRNKIFKNIFGHTLVELLVGLSIIGLISSMVVVNMRNTGQTASLDSAALKLVSDIRLVQDHALGLKDKDGSYPAGGWGLYLRKVNPNNESYQIFADVNNNHEYDSGVVEDFNKIDLQGDVIISNLDLDGSQRNTIHLIFIPPDPTVSICYNPASCVSPAGRDLIITLSQGTDSRDIVVNNFGLIDIEN